MKTCSLTHANERSHKKKHNMVCTHTSDPQCSRAAEWNEWGSASRHHKHGTTAGCLRDPVRLHAVATQRPSPEDPPLLPGAISRLLCPLSEADTRMGPGHTPLPRTDTPPYLASESQGLASNNSGSQPLLSALRQY